MASKSKNSKRSTWLETYKGIRKEPTPPGRVIQSQDRDIIDDEDEREIRKWESWRGEDFEDFEE